MHYIGSSHQLQDLCKLAWRLRSQVRDSVYRRHTAYKVWGMMTTSDEPLSTDTLLSTDMTLLALQDAKDGKYYVFANEGDIYTDAAGNEFSYVTVIDTQAAAVRPAPAHVISWLQVD